MQHGLDACPRPFSSERPHELSYIHTSVLCGVSHILVLSAVWLWLAKVEAFKTRIDTIVGVMFCLRRIVAMRASVFKRVAVESLSSAIYKTSYFGTTYQKYFFCGKLSLSTNAVRLLFTECRGVHAWAAHL